MLPPLVNDLIYSAKSFKNLSVTLKISTLNPWLRRALQVSIYEAFAIAAITIGALILTDETVFSSAAYAASTSVVAITWNYIYNTLFEYWETRQTIKGRSVRRRIAHAIGFELGLVATLVPLMAWWFHISLTAAFIAEIGLMIFFMVYTFIFNWGFDRVVGLPRSAQPVTSL